MSESDSKPARSPLVHATSTPATSTRPTSAEATSALANAVAVGHPTQSNPMDALGALWTAAGGEAAALDHVHLTGEPILPSVFRVSEMAQITTAATGLAAAGIARDRFSTEQTVSVDARHAEVAFLSERYLEVEGDWPDHSRPTWGYYRTRDDRWLQVHTTFAHHQAGAARLLGAQPTRASFEEAIRRLDAEPFEQAMADAGLPCTVMRSRDEWLAHPQGAAVAQSPLMDITRIGNAPPLPAAEGTRPLSGLRVLDLTRVIAGPVCGRTLTEHGATVMRVASPHLPSVPRLVIDSGRGKLSTHLDLRSPADTARFDALLGNANVMVQGYRPGAIAGLGYDAEHAAAIRPGIVYVSVCAFGYAGPWQSRRGFDSLVQIASGIADAGRAAIGAEQPAPLPCQALDHATGYLAAFGAMMALRQQWREGGSWHVRVSLAQCAQWLSQLGRVDRMALEAPTDVTDLLDECDSPFGRTRFVRPVAQLSKTPGYWATPAAPLGTHAPHWP
jgi:crotonobetainyl-CoA:carnitine CoA-transferase CaiB-like acyl-CoA transferase